MIYVIVQRVLIETGHTIEHSAREVECFMLVIPGYDESVGVERSWSQSPHQAFQAGLDEDDQAVGQGEEVGHPRGVLRVAVL